MKIKHFAGYGTVEAKKMPANGATLHIRVSGNHECGLRRDDEYDLFNWLIRKFDKSIPDYPTWHRMRPIIEIHEGWNVETDYCDYYFTYSKSQNMW
jgi:hypothetical protein